MKILLVEDEPSSRLVFEKQLRVWGYEVIVCADAETALEIYQQTFYPLIVLDLGLPGMDGLELCRRIRSLPQGDRSMILVITAWGTPEDLQDALDAGADDYLIKPVSMKLLKMRLTIIERQLHNLTERKRAEEELRQLEKAVETMQVGVTITDTKGKIIYTNPAEAKMHGYQVEDLIGKDMGIFAPPEMRNPLSLEQIKAMKHRVRESVNIRKDGSTFPVQLISDVVSNIERDPIAIVTVCEDITERKRAEQALQESEERFREMADNIRDGLSIIEQGKVVYVNDRVCEITGRSKEELLTTDALAFAAPEEKERLQHIMQEAHETGKLSTEMEFWIIRKDGERRCIRNYYTVKGWEDDFVDRYVITTDITEHRLHELALEEEKEHLKKVNIVLKSIMKDRYRFGEIIGKSPVMQEVYELIANAAASDANVVIHGESGTGKELVAWTIHYLSTRKEKVFAPVNCGAVTESLFESAFFGHRKGSFTGAHKDKFGFFDHAHGGTLFLDEVGELGLSMQTKFLRVLAGGGHTPVGDHTVRKANVRIIAATNRNLTDMVKQGTMRRDFFFRIHVVPITVPPLRKRREDIPLLIDHFLEQYSIGKQKQMLPATILEQLYKYDWPGNVRELQNVLQRYLTTKRLEFTDIASTEPVGREETSGTEITVQEDLELHQAVEEFEKSYIAKILEQHRWHRGKTATTLGIDPRTLYRKIKDYRLS